MELTVKNLAAELKRQLIDELSLEAPVGGGMNHVVARTFISSSNEVALCHEACEELLLQLAKDYPSWGVEVDGHPGVQYEVVVTLSR